MLFHGLYHYAKPMPGKILPKLNNYIDTMNTRRLFITSRHVNAEGFESAAVRLLRKILADAPMHLLLQKADDFSRYLDIVHPIKSDLDDIYDPNSTGIQHRGVFVHSSNKCEEFIFPIQMADPIKQMPMEGGWGAWMDMRPVRLLDADTDELSLHFTHDQLYFRTHPPRRAVIGIDVECLVLQYTNYCLATSKIDRLTVQEYLHRYVMIGLLEDLQVLWLRNRYLDVLTNPIYSHSSRIDVNEHIYDNLYGYIGTHYPGAIQEVFSLFQNCKKGAVAPAVVLSSLRAVSGDMSTYFTGLADLTQVDSGRQTLWYEYLRDIGWVKLILALYQTQPNYPQTVNLIRLLKRDIPLALNMKFWANCKSSSVRDHIEAEITDLNTSLQTMRIL